MLGLLCVFAVSLNAQNEDPLDTILQMQVDPFDHQNELGQALNAFLIRFENFGHLGYEQGGYTDKNSINQFVKLFKPEAQIQDDISDTLNIGKQIAIEKYAKVALGKKYLNYSLIVEKKLIEANRIDSGRYKGVYNFFKLYSNKSVIGKTYRHGAKYTMELEFNRNGTDIQINSLVMQDSAEYFVFKLGNFGYTSNNLIKASYNLNNLVQEPSEFAKAQFAPPKDSSLYRAGITVMAHGAYVLPSHLGPVGYAENLNPDVPTTNSQWGWKAGLKIFLPSGKEGNFNFTLGLGVETHHYEVSYQGLSFVYDTDCFGDPLKDLEQTEYDQKFVDVSSSTESGSLSYLTPEVGVLYHIGLGEKMKLSLFGNVGFAYLNNSSYRSESVVSYRGKQLSLGIIDVEQLGFYQDYNKVAEGEVSNAISFYRAGVGGSLDFSLGEKNRSWLAFSFELNTGLSPAFDTGYEFCPFLDVAVNDTFLSTFTNTTQTINYESMAIGVSYRYQFPKK